MPNHFRKGKSQTRRKSAGHSSQSDFTVYEYSNSGRLSKATMNSFKAEAKQLTSKKVEKEAALAWYERDLSDFSDSEKDSVDTEETENKDQLAALEASLSGTRNRHRRKKAAPRGDQDDSGHMHSIYVWMVIGDQIHPEDVNRFAGICRGSHIVTHTAHFWLKLYERHYNVAVKLPDTLQPKYIDRIHGLQARVIRSLFYLYPPFQQRLHSRAPFEEDPECLKGATCTLMWFKQLSKHWHFFFKFQLHSNNKLCCPFVRHCKRTSIRDDPDIHANPEAHNCVLQVISQNFIPCSPSIMGQVLAKSTLSVGHAMRYHRMKLTFTPQQYTPIKSNNYPCGTTIVLDPVLNTHVIHWWDPKYPHQPD